MTLTRASLAVGVAALVADSFDGPAPVATLVTLTVVALALDCVDGWIVRRTGTAIGAGRALRRRGRRVPDPRPERVRRAARPARGCSRSARCATRSSSPGGCCRGCRSRCRRATGPRSSPRRRAVVLTIAAADILPLGADASHARRRARPARRVVRPRHRVAVGPPARRAQPQGGSRPRRRPAPRPPPARARANGDRRGAHDPRRAGRVGRPRRAGPARIVSRPARS